MKSRILIVDDEPNILQSFSRLLQDEGYVTITTETAEQAMQECRSGSFDLVLLDLRLPKQSGIDFLKWLKKEAYPPVVLVISGQSDIPTALEAVKLGAIDYLEKPVAAEKLVLSVRSALLLAQANRQRHLLVDDIDSQSRIVGESQAVRRLLKTIEQAAPTDSTVLITGENGTGKELVVTRLYLSSGRRDRPFVRVNCPGIPSTLFESELFGHVKGAFTGAVKDYPGKFVLADGGTILLDEIGDLPTECQAKLLRTLETGEVETLGSVQKRQADVRVICATNRNLPQLVGDDRFREDLYYRISVFTIPVPPLRERRQDIPLLVGEFLRRFDPSGSTSLSPEAMAYLTTLDYPGNVRQLKNLIEKLTILFRNQVISLTDIQMHSTHIAPERQVDSTASSLAEKLREFEKQLISQTLRQTGGNISEASRILRIDRANLSRRVKELGLKNR
ncbi:MAG: sigma-54 dependent transcriptional regulator [Candidatus Zixiibacteriota bacterium]